MDASATVSDAMIDADSATDGATRSYRDEVLADFPAMYLRLGEAGGSLKAADVTGDNHPGTYSEAGLTLGVPGAIVNDPDTAVSFDGAHAIHVGPSFDFGNGSPFSVEIWAKGDGDLVEHRRGDHVHGSLERRHRGARRVCTLHTCALRRPRRGALPRGKRGPVGSDGPSSRTTSIVVA